MKILINNDNLENEFIVNIENLSKILHSEFGGEFEITSDEKSVLEEKQSWTHSLYVRKGAKAGAEVNLIWNPDKPNELEVNVEESSKLGNGILLYTTGIIFSLGVLLAYTKTPPLQDLPGQKIAGLIGGFIFLLPAVIIAFTLKYFLTKNHSEENKQLVDKVNEKLNSNISFVE